jgi:hypothetical protein
LKVIDRCVKCIFVSNALVGHPLERHTAAIMKILGKPGSAPGYAITMTEQSESGKSPPPFCRRALDRPKTTFVLSGNSGATTTCLKMDQNCFTRSSILDRSISGVSFHSIYADISSGRTGGIPIALEWRRDFDWRRYGCLKGPLR